MIKIICLQNWWSVGEGLRTINQVCTLINFLRKIYPNQLYFVLNFLDNDFIVKNCIGFSKVSKIPNEFYIKNIEYSYDNVIKNDFIPLIPGFHTFIHKENFDFLNNLKFMYNNIEYTGIQNAINFYIDEVHTHHLNKIGQNLDLIPEDFIEHSKEHVCHVELNENIENISEKIINTIEYTNFDSIFFRWEIGFNEVEDTKIIESYINKLIPFIDKNKYYFISSNYSLFYEIIRYKIPNFFYIHRGRFDKFTKKSEKNYNYEPTIIVSNNDKIKTINDFNLIEFETSNIDYKIINNYIAHIELSLICKSNEIFYMTEKTRNNISLFLWLPSLKYSIPINWINIPTNELIKRKYNFEKCIFGEKIKLKN